MEPIENQLQTVLRDVSEGIPGQLQVSIDCRSSGINIRPDGYGDFESEDGSGAPIYLELYQGELRLIVWSDINDQDPTHVINLSGSKVECRVNSRAV